MTKKEIELENKAFKEALPKLTTRQARLLKFIYDYEQTYKQKNEIVDIEEDLGVLRAIGYIHSRDNVIFTDMVVKDRIALYNSTLREAQDVITGDGLRIERMANAIRNAYPSGRKDNTFPWKSSLAVTKTRLVSLENKVGVTLDPAKVEAAVKAYVASYGSNTRYMCLADYFIFKNDKEKGFSSPLLNIIERMDNGEEIKHSSGTFDYSETL